MGSVSKAVLAVMALMVTVFSGTAVGQTVPKISDVDRAQGEGVLYSAQAKALEARTNAETKRRSLGDGMPALQMVVAVESSQDKGARMSVTLQYPGGTHVEATEGDMIPGGYKVGKINAARNQVTLIRGGENIVIGFGGRAGASR